MDGVEVLFRRAAAVQRAGDYAAAVELYREVLRARPGFSPAEENLCLALLAAGDYAEGFRRYDIRFTRKLGRVAKPALSFPEWRGEPLAGRSLLVWMEQGFGDQIMFARFIPVLAAMGAEISLLAPPPLVRLFASLPARIIAAEGRVAIPPHDFWIMPASIPGLLGVTEAAIPAAPYLPGAPSGSGIGVASRGDPRHPNDSERSLPPAAAAELLALPGAVSLLPEDTGAPDFEATAELVRGLEQVITVDTSLAHLAGAMGKPTWVLLPAQNCCWRWQSGREDSPWYPSVRLFRQRTAGAWAPVLAAVAAALRDDPA